MMYPRLTRIDGLRGLAILGVVAIHSLTAFPTNSYFPSLGKYGVQSYVLLAFPFLVYSKSKLIKLLLDNHYICFIGRISYSVYFVHYTVIQLAAYFFYSNILYLNGFIIILLNSCLIGYLSYKYIEKVGINLGNTIIVKLQANE